MPSLGIDLAAQDKNTAYCAIEWVSGMALVETPVLDADDDTLVAEIAKSEWTGIDAPFGWPDDFVEAVSTFTENGDWPANAKSERLRHRETDRFTHDHVEQEAAVSVWPLSVSSDRIAVCAWRCARLLSRLARETGWPFDRIGVPLTTGMDGPPDEPRPQGLVAKRGVVEVYPAATLALWGLPHKDYKPRSSATRALTWRNRRRDIVEGLEAAAGGWLILSDDVREKISTEHDCLDAMIAGIAACAAATDRTVKPTMEQRGAAQHEGWIHLPAADCLPTLAPGKV